MEFNERKRRWLNNLPEKYRPNSVHKLNALSNVDTRNKIYFGDRQTGRTHLLMLDIVYDALTGEGNRRIGVATPNLGSTRYLFDKTRDLFDELFGDTIERCTVNPNRIYLRNGTLISFFCISDNMRGHKLDGIYIDNVDFLNERSFEIILFLSLEVINFPIIATSLPINENNEVAASIARRILGGN